MEYNSESNRASEITSTITPELFDMKSYYQLIIASITKCEKLFKSAVRRKTVKI